MLQSAPPGCASGCGDSHRRTVAGGFPRGHARRTRAAAGPRGSARRLVLQGLPVMQACNFFLIAVYLQLTQIRRLGTRNRLLIYSRACCTWCAAPDTNRAAGLHSLSVAPKSAHRTSIELTCCWSDPLKASSTLRLARKKDEWRMFATTVSFRSWHGC